MKTARVATTVPPRADPPADAPRPRRRPGKLEPAAPAPRPDPVRAAGEYARRNLRAGGARKLPTELATLLDTRTLDVAWDHELAVLHRCASATRRVNVAAVMDAAARKLLKHDVSDEIFHQVFFKAAQKAQDSDGVTHPDLMARLFLLRVAIVAQRSGIALPPDMQRRVFRALADTREVTLGCLERQEHLLRTAGQRRAAADLLDLLGEVRRLRGTLSHYALEQPITDAKNDRVVDYLRAGLENLQSSLQREMQDKLGVFRPGQIKELMALSAVVAQGLEGAAALAEGFHEFQRRRPANLAGAEPEIRGILRDVHEAMPRSKQRFGHDKMRDALLALGRRLAVLAESVDGTLPPFAVDAAHRGRLAKLVEKTSKTSVTVPDAASSWPSFELELVRADFAPRGWGGVPGKYTFFVGPDDRTYIAGRDGVWQTTWPHDLSPPR